MTMTEQTAPPRQPDVTPAAEPQPAAKELLNIENYGAVYGRLLFATQLSVEDGLKILNPETTVTTMPRIDNPTAERNYNPFVEPLSTNERKKAWEGRDLNEARTEWGSKFKAAITNSDKTDRIAVIKALIGKDAADIKDEDVDEIYNKYCKDKSNITAYVNDIITGFTEKGTGIINHEEIEGKIAEIQWVASKLFGTKSSEIAVIIANLEVIIKTKGKPGIAPFYTTAGLNDWKEPGKKLLTIFKPETPVAVPPATAPAAPEPEKDGSRKLPVLAAVTSENLETYRSQNKDVLLNGVLWQIVEIKQDGRVIIKRNRSIQELLDLLGNMKAKGHGLFMPSSVEQRASLPISEFIRGGRWVVERGIRSPNDPEYQKEVNEIKSLRERINAGEFDNKYNEVSVLMDAADLHTQRLNEELLTYSTMPTAATGPAPDSDADVAPAPIAPPETATGAEDIVAQVLSPDNKTPDGESYILPKEWFAHEGLDFNQTTANPQFQQFIKSLSERLGKSVPSEVRLSQSFSAEELQEAYPQWQGLNLGIFVKAADQGEWDTLGTDAFISLSASMKHSTVPKIHQQSWTNQRYRNLETHLEEAFKGRVRVGGSMDLDHNLLSTDLVWIGDSTPRERLTLNLSPDGMTISLAMDNPGSVASNVSRNLTGLKSELAFQRFFSVLNALTPLMRQPAFKETTPESAAATPSAVEPEAGEPKPEEEYITLYYSKDEGLKGLTDSVIRNVGEHQGEQSITFKMSISDVLPQLIPLVLKDQLEDPEKPGVVDFVGQDERKPVIRDVQIKDGDRLRLIIRNSADQKGIEVEADEGNPGDEVKETLTHFNPLMIYAFNTPLQEVYQDAEVRKIYLKGKGKEMYLGMDVTPNKNVRVTQPLPVESVQPVSPTPSEAAATELIPPEGDTI